VTYPSANRSHVYLGEFEDDEAAETYVSDADWDTEGNPQNGMQYYNTTSNALKVYLNGSWKTFTTS
jgi:hypothetical protein